MSLIAHYPLDKINTYNVGFLRSNPRTSSDLTGTYLNESLINELNLAFPAITNTGLSYVLEIYHKDLESGVTLYVNGVSFGAINGPDNIVDLKTVSVPVANLLTNDTNKVVLKLTASDYGEIYHIRLKSTDNSYNTIIDINGYIIDAAAIAPRLVYYFPPVQEEYKNYCRIELTYGYLLNACTVKINGKNITVQSPSVSSTPYATTIPTGYLSSESYNVVEIESANRQYPCHIQGVKILAETYVQGVYPDISGNGYHMIVRNRDGLTPAVMDRVKSNQSPINGMNFSSGNVDFLRADAFPNVFSKSYSICFTAKFSDLSTQDMGILDYAEAAALNKNILLMIRNGGLLFSSWGNDLMSTAGGFAINELHRFVCVYNHIDKTKKIYIDGVLNATQTNTAQSAITLSSANLMLFMRGGTTVAGQFADFRIYDNALSDAEVYGYDNNLGSNLNPLGFVRVFESYNICIAGNTFNSMTIPPCFIYDVRVIKTMVLYANNASPVRPTTSWYPTVEYNAFWLYYGRNSIGKKVSYSGIAPTLYGTFDTNDIIYNYTDIAHGWRCTTAGTFGTLTGYTGTVDATNHKKISISALDHKLYPGDYITIAGVTGVKKVLNIVNLVSDPNTKYIVVDTDCDAVVTGVAIAFSAPAFTTF